MKLYNIRIEKDETSKLCADVMYNDIKSTLWYEVDNKYSKYLCTELADSFLIAILPFAILFKRPFIVFEREDKTINMSSRIQTLLSKFKLENRKYNDRIDNSMLKCDYNDAYIILRKEREKSKIFLKNALNLYGSDKNE